MKHLIDATTHEVLLNQVEVADTFWQRFKGLQFRSPLPADTGLLITPCSSLHTCFMRFPIDVVMLDQELCVVGIRKQVRPWKAILCVSGTKSVVEMTAVSKDWEVGRKLQLVSGLEERPCKH
ncbi:DUF192 domain-containing protein [Rhodopirellula baltica]|jgi:hypothetical protein|uniref:Protein containing DUF192 n=1 Tax=Rhodopirellula baltica WH47 TaxID=991778 RepID=F2B012_RHOBT|nr:DUF192 domain-containing protein [Rhodopirellula baltica]EGF24765.1 protein containing DUF192 [Rhodopirellula baltica WH47]